MLREGKSSLRTLMRISTRRDREVGLLALFVVFWIWLEEALAKVLYMNRIYSFIAVTLNRKDEL